MKHLRQTGDNRRRKNQIILFVLLAGLAAAVALGVYFIHIRRTASHTGMTTSAVFETPEPTPVSTPTPTPSPTETPEPTPTPVVIPVDFDYLQGINSDVVGWIMIDGTDIDYPVLYDTSDDTFYLSHTYSGDYLVAGSIFFMDDNSADFSDFNTVVYGHNMADGTMFAQLHRFEDADFFAEHDSVIIYTNHSKLTYQIFAAYQTDNLNIVLNNDFSTTQGKEDYLSGIYQHSYALYDYDVPVAVGDRIITLSTCIGNAAYRYVVQGVLISEEPGVLERCDNEN